MPKQIKIGFDKTSARPTLVDRVLVDVRGNNLFDINGQFLFTETSEVPQSFFSSRNSSSVYINNQATDQVRPAGSIAIQEQFLDTSDVSNSLLGVPRAEQQQTLLSDVSIYGLDDTWEFYRNPNPFEPEEWRKRLNQTYGRRFNPRLKEHPKEQALALEMFPTPWRFPFGPRWESQGRFDQTLFNRYRQFIQLGNELYDFYKEGSETFAERHFLIPGMAEVDGDDIVYNQDFDLALQYIEQWTITWMDIRDRRLDDPFGLKLDAARINAVFGVGEGAINFDDTQPGYSSSNYRYCQLQSRESFRYQPGAVSGFTFGVKLKAEPNDLNNFLEWGCANETDQLMFQVRGAQFNIVRRSTVQLGRRNLELNGFPIDAERPIESPNPYERNTNSFTTTDLGLPPQNRPQLYELVIRSDDFNGDPLDGSGPSGYTISFEEVTMYKIEYSWYGAVGAKFYAYIPVGNDDARWVLLHTLIIENTLDFPSLQNPFMHFRYSLYLSNSLNIREPLFLYKYGASYYIDGTDEGSSSFNSYKLPVERSTTSANSTPLIGFIPKDTILNRDGIGNFNQKNFYIEKISASSFGKNARIDFVECEGCPGGHGHFYATSLQNGSRGLVDQFRITAAGNLVFVDPGKTFDVFSDSKKIIGPGIFSSYVFPIEGDNQALNIRRKLGSQRINTPIDNISYTNEDQVLIGGEQRSLIGYEFEGRLTGYDDIIASTVPITKPNIKVQFLNPIATESTGQWAEFRIGITAKKPELVSSEDGESQILLFRDKPLDLENEVYGEFAQFQARKNAQGIETGEWDPRTGNTMEQDPRIRRPRGASSGNCSELNFFIDDSNTITDVSYSPTDPTAPNSPGNFLIFETDPPFTEPLGNSIGVFDGNRFISSGIEFTSDLRSFVDPSDDSIKFVASISGNILAVPNIDFTRGISLRTIRCFGRFINFTQLLPFEANEYYLFIAMRDNARINNIVVQEFDSVSSFSHTPNWIKGSDSNIDIIQVGNPNPSAAVFDKLPNTNEYIDTDGRFNMGGVSFTNNPSANFTENTRLDSVRFDNQLSLPLRPSTLKSSVYLSGNKTETVDLTHIFAADRYKLTRGSFNNKYLYVSSIITDPGETGTIQINISGREQ